MKMSKKVELELLWWVFTFLLAVIIILPIRINECPFPFYFQNVIFFVTFLTLSRYIFLLKHTFLPPYQYIKAGLIFLSAPVVFLLVQELNGFQVFLDAEGPEALVGRGFEFKKQEVLIKYIRSEMLLFGVGSIISAILFPLRLVLSIWRWHNLGKA